MDDPLRVDLEMIRRSLALLIQPGTVSELRIVNTHVQTVSGYYSDMEKLARDAERWSGKAPAVYLTIDPVREDLLARANNRLIERARSTTKDEDILRRNWLKIDFDPERPADISSSDEEHRAAIDRAEECRKWLYKRGFPPLIKADSGNGGHLLGRVALPNDKASELLLAACLEALGREFSGGGVKVDEKTFNAARIWKLYGTLAAKGDSIPGRPHRLAKLLDVPKAAVIPIELLEELAKHGTAEKIVSVPTVTRNGKVAARTGARQGDYATLDIVALFRAHAAYGRDMGGGKHAVRCPWEGEHSTLRQAEESDTAVWEAAGGGWAQFHCLHDHCKGRGIQQVAEVWSDTEGFCVKEWDTGSWTVGALQQATDAAKALEEQAQRPNFASIQPMRIVESDPPHYFPTINGAEVELSPLEIARWDRFKTACIQKLFFVPVLPSAAKSLTPQAIWEHYVLSPALRHASREPAPPDAGTSGAAWENVRAFLRHRQPATTKEAAYQNKLALIDGVYWFRGDALRSWLFKNNRLTVKEDELWNVVKKHGATYANRRTNDGVAKFWMLPESVLEESGTVPEGEEEAVESVEKPTVVTSAK